MRQLAKDGYTNVISRSRAELDLTDQAVVRAFFEQNRPEYVFHCAAKVGGVFANNTYRADFLYENLLMQSHVIHQAFMSEVKKLVFFASADIYPPSAKQPVSEDALLNAPLEPTCEPFALAKIAGLKMCEAYNHQYGTEFVVVVPPSVYGPRQHYDTLTAQVLPSLIQKFHEAKLVKAPEIEIWGTGKPVRDFIYVDDVADAACFLMSNYTEHTVYNIGTGQGFKIAELAEMVALIVGYEGRIVYNSSKPDGVAKKLLDVTRVSGLGWKPKTHLRDGVQKAYQAFQEEIDRKEVRASQIVHVSHCQKDGMALRGIKASLNIASKTQPPTYRDLVVIKPWGYEFLVFENDAVAIWMLHIKKGHATSMHCHPLKKTSLILLSGSAMSNTFMNRRFLRDGDAIVLERGIFHSTKALTEDGIYVLEIETPPDKVDLVRLEDSYGRSGFGYEGVSEMRSSNLQEFGYFFLTEEQLSMTHTHRHSKYSITFEVFTTPEDYVRSLRIDTSALYTICKGALYDQEQCPILAVGDTEKGEVLLNTKGLCIHGPTIVLKTTAAGRA